VDGAKFEGHSVSRTDYQFHEGARPEKSFKPNLTNREAAPEDRDFRTANSDFDEKHDYPERAKAPLQQTHTEAHPFEGQSVARSSYTQFKDFRPPGPIKPKAAVLQTSGEDRDFKSVAGSTYTQLPYARRDPYVPKSQALDQSAPFTATSNYRNDFAAHEGAERALPIKPAPSAFESAGKFDGRTRNQDDFKAYPEHRPPKSFKPGTTMTTSQGDDRTFNSESRSSYTAKTAELCPTAHLREKQLKHASGHKMYLAHEGRWTPEHGFLQRKSGSLSLSGQLQVTGGIPASPPQRQGQQAAPQSA